MVVISKLVGYRDGMVVISKLVSCRILRWNGSDQ